MRGYDEFVETDRYQIRGFHYLCNSPTMKLKQTKWWRWDFQLVGNGSPMTGGVLPVDSKIDSCSNYDFLAMRRCTRVVILRLRTANKYTKEIWKVVYTDGRVYIHGYTNNEKNEGELEWKKKINENVYIYLYTHGTITKKLWSSIGSGTQMRQVISRHSVWVKSPNSRLYVHGRGNLHRPRKRKAVLSSGTSSCPSIRSPNIQYHERVFGWSRSGKDEHGRWVYMYRCTNRRIEGKRSSCSHSWKL